MKKFLQKETGKLISWLCGFATIIFVMVCSVQSTSLFAYIGSKEDYNKDLEETLATANEQSARLISAPLSLYTGYILSDDFINYAKSLGMEGGKADRWLTESRVISTIFNTFSLYLSYEKSDSIGMTANSIKVLLNLATFADMNPIPPPWGPIVNLLITGAQITAESYQAVAQTGREVQIEELYFLLRQDKKLRPERGDMINMDTRENVNYIFDKFLMSGNTKLRTLVNSYLVEKLGKSIPTEDMKNRLNFNTGMGLEAPEEVITVEEFYLQNRQEIETYLAAILADINLLLKAQFNEINLRKEFIAQKPLLEELEKINKQYGNIIEKVEDWKKTNLELTQKYAKLAQNFNARLADAKSKNTGTAAREVRDEAQYAIMTIEEKGYYAEDPRAEFLNKALGGDKLIEYLKILRPGFKQARALAKALGEKEDAEEKKAYEEYVKNSQAIIQGFASFKLDKYPLDSKMAEFKEKIDKYFREGGRNDSEIFNSLGVDKFSEEFDVFYKKQWEEQKKANIEKFKEVDRLWQNVDNQWEKSEEFASVAKSNDSEAFKRAQMAFIKRRDEKYAEIEKIRDKVFAAWNLFCKEFEQNSGFSPGSVSGTMGDASSYELGGQGFYAFVPFLRERIAEWMRIVKMAGEEQSEIYSNAQPPELLNDVDSFIKSNDRIISDSEKWAYPEASLEKIPGIDENNLSETLQKLKDALSKRETAFSDDFSTYYDSTLSTGVETSFSIISSQINKVDERIKELRAYITERTKANQQADSSLARWKITLPAGTDTTIESADKLIKSLERFKRTVPETLKKLEGLYENARDEVADQRGFIQARIVLVKSLISLPLLTNFEKTKDSIKAGYPLKASHINEGAKGYLNREEVSKLKEDISRTMTPERMQALQSSSPKIHKQVVEIINLVSKIKPVGDNEVAGLDGVPITASEQQAELRKAGLLSELNALNWEKILTENDIDIDSSNVFAANYRKRLGELKEKEDEANAMVQKASMPVVIKSVKINGKVFTGEVIEVDFAKDKIIKITGEIESGVNPREVMVSTDGTDFVKGNFGSSSEREGKVFTSFSYDLPIGVVAGTSGKVTIASSAGGSNGYQELTIKVSGASQDNALAGLNNFLDEARKIRPEGDYHAKFNQIREKMVVYLKDSGLSPGAPEVVSIMNEVSKIESALGSTTSPVQMPSGQVPPPMGHGGTVPGGMGSPTGSPVLAEFYKLYDARLNTRSLQNATGGDVVVIAADLRSGGIEVTARLSTMERIQTLLISEDDGRTWTELPVNQNLSYKFSPMAEKRYQLVLKIKTTDSQEATLPFFPNINAIIYRNISYADLVKDVVTKIANAYESQSTADFASLISRDYLGNRVFLEEGVRFDFDMFTDIRLKIFIDRIEQHGDLYLADTHWEKSQNPRKTGQQQMTTGRTVMTFSLEDGSLKIKNLRGDLIYATLSPEIAEASGLSQTVVEEIRVAEFERNPVQPGAGETVNAGGTSQNLSVRNGTVHSVAGVSNNSFAFASGTESTTPAAGDIQFESDMMGPTYVFEANAPAKIQEVTGTYTFESLTYAPMVVDEGPVFLSAGDVILLVTTQGYYCKIKITSVTIDGMGNATAQFNYAVQTDGSRNLNTL